MHVRAEDGTRLYVRSRQGPRALTALLCDGIACDGFIWKYLWDELAQHVSVAHYHYRGHGRSSAPVDTERIDVAAHVADLGAVRRALADPPLVIIGHSFGTQVALEAYRDRAEGIRGLISLCGSFGRVTHTFKGTDLLANVLPDLTRLSTEYPSLARALWSNVPVEIALRLGRFTGDLDDRVSPSDVAPYFEHVRSLDFTMFLRMLNAAGEHSAEDLLPSLRVPTLVIAGGRDSFTPVGVTRRTAEAIPGAELVLMPEGTHLTPFEYKTEVREAILSFLERRVY